MRAFIIGSKNLSCLILDALLAEGHEVVGVYARDEEKGMPVWHELGHRNLAQEAAEHGIPVHSGMKVNSPESLKLLGALQLDIILSCFWSEIFKEPILNVAKLGAFNFHTAYLPNNRGSRPIPWALIKGEDHTGITVHKMMTGVDNGPIVDQIKVPIEPSDTAETLYNKVTEAGGMLAKKVISSFADGSYQLQLQDESQATYQPRGEPYGRQINPLWTEDQTNRFKRAFEFPPFSGAIEPPSPAMKGASKVYLLPSFNIKKELDWENIIALNIPITCFSENLAEKFESSAAVELLYDESDLLVGQEKTAESRALIHQLKSKLKKRQAHQSTLGIRPGIMTRNGLSKSFRALDVLASHKFSYVSSQMMPMNEGAIRDLQPYRYENGMLEIPSVSWSGKDDLLTLVHDAIVFMNQTERDVFIGLNLNLQASEMDDVVSIIKEVLEHKKCELLTYREVCEHYNSNRT